MDDNTLLRYSRHIFLPQIGFEGQDKLVKATVLVVGAGGLGCPAALYLGASGVGKLIIGDADQVDISNLQRQIGHRTESIGRNKADSLGNNVRLINPGVEVEVLQQRLEGESLNDAVARADVIVDCSDNFATRHAVNRASRSFDKPLVSGAAIAFSGQVAVFDPRHPDSPCYQCLFAETREEGMRCSEAGVLSPLVGLVGSLEAMETIKLLAGAGEAAVGQLILIDALNTTFRKIRVPRDPACPVCGSGQRHHA